MAISYQNSAYFSSASNAFDAGTGTNRIMVFLLGNGANNIRPTAPTFNGSSATFIREMTTNSVNFSVWYLIAPTTGSHNVVIDAGNSVTVGVWNGAKQTSQPDASTSSQSAGATKTQTNSLTTVADLCWIVCGGYFPNGGVLTGGTNATQRASGVSGNICDTNADVTPAGSTSQTINSDTNQTIGVKMLQVSIVPVTVVTMTVTVGSFTLTGENVGLMLIVKMTVAVGSFALTGIDVVLRAAIRMVAGTGLFTLTGNSILVKLHEWVKATKSSTSWSQANKDTSTFTVPLKSSTNWDNTTKS